MNKVNFVFYGQEGSIFEIHFPLVRNFLTGTIWDQSEGV